MANKKQSTHTTQQLTNNQQEMLELRLNRMLLGNMLGSRMDFAKKSGMYGQYGGHRQIRSTAGYTDNPSFNDFLDAYNTQDVAARVIETYPDHTWITWPEVYEVEEPKNTQFESDWLSLLDRRKVISNLRAFDILAGIGRFGLLVIGVDDGRALEMPFVPNRKKHDIIYMRSYMEGEVTVQTWNTDIHSERYMLPILYKVTPTIKLEGANVIGDGSFLVHYTRTLHFADHAINSSVYGIPRLQRVYDRMTDILKIAAGSGEMFWRGAYQGFSFEADSDASISDEEQKEMEKAIQKYFMGLDRAMLLRGVTAKQLTPAIHSPKDHLDVQLTIVSIASRIPRRILTGSEMGKLASTQDAENWAQQIKIRRTNTAEPYILRPFVEFCLRNRIVSTPKDGANFNIYWPALEIPTDKDTSESAVNFTNALQKYAISSLYTIMNFKDYLVKVWKYSTAEAEQLADSFKPDAFEALRIKLAGDTQTTESNTPKASTGESSDT